MSKALNSRNQSQLLTFTDKESVLTSLECCTCQKMLNVAPILYNEHVGYICGRCNSGDQAVQLIGLGSVSRQHLYEELMKFLTFPCSFEQLGCKKMLTFQEVKEHESTCEQRQCVCPLSVEELSSAGCKFKGTLQELSEHIKIHITNILDPPQLEWPSVSENKVFFTSVGSHLVTVVIKHLKDDTFITTVLFNGNDVESQCFRYQLQLFDKDKESSLILRRNRLESIADFPDNLKCREKSMEIDLNKIRPMLNNTALVLVKFGIVKKHKKEIVQITGDANSQFLTLPKTAPHTSNDYNEEMLSELECPICNEYMTPPIFICTLGHSICQPCRKQVDMLCPTCRCAFKEGRNFSLESLSLKLNYPCVNRDAGCNFVATGDKIKKHCKICYLTFHGCIYCDWEGQIVDLYSHMLEEHNQYVIEPNTAVVLDIKSEKGYKIYYLFVHGALFYIAFQCLGKMSLKFIVTHVPFRTDDSESKFMYTIQFSQAKATTSPFVAFSDFCNSWTGEYPDLKTTDCLFAPGDVLKNYTFNVSNIYFMVRIDKV